MVSNRRFAAFILLAAPVVFGTLGAADSSAPAEILVSRQLSNRAHLAIGDVVTIAADPAATRSARFRVVGVYEPTPDPMRFNVERLEARLHLPDVVTLTADPADPQTTELATVVNVALVDPADRDRLAAELAARSLGLIVRPTARAREGDPFAVLERFHLAIAAVTVAGSTAFLIALMVIRADERRETIGVLRLIGISRRSILLEVVVEALCIAMVGAVFGVLLAVSAERGVNAYFQHRYDTPLVFVRVTPSIAARSVGVALPVGVVAGVVASWTLLRRRASALVRR
jgi:ABC-type lipoprotein release transport system permease subunit